MYTISLIWRSTRLGKQFTMMMSALDDVWQPMRVSNDSVCRKAERLSTCWKISEWRFIVDRVRFSSW